MDDHQPAALLTHRLNRRGRGVDWHLRSLRRRACACRLVALSRRFAARAATSCSAARSPVCWAWSSWARRLVVAVSGADLIRAVVARVGAGPAACAWVGPLLIRPIAKPIAS